MGKLHGSQRGAATALRAHVTSRFGTLSSRPAAAHEGLVAPEGADVPQRGQRAALVGRDLAAHSSLKRSGARPTNSDPTKEPRT